MSGHGTFRSEGSPPPYNPLSAVLWVNLNNAWASQVTLAQDYGKTIKPLEIPWLDTQSQTLEQTTAIASIVDAVRKEVKAHGTVGELRFSSHASPSFLYLGQNGEKGSINLSNLVNALTVLQEEPGMPKIANKISFIGCNTFNNLSPEWVDYFRKASKRLGSELVGTTDFTNGHFVPGLQYVKTISFKNGDVGHFTPDSNGGPAFPSNFLIASALKAYSKYQGLNYSSDWVNCHEGHSQRYGAICQREQAAREAAEPKKEVLAGFTLIPRPRDQNSPGGP
jgi:hypothetical protein